MVKTAFLTSLLGPVSSYGVSWLDRETIVFGVRNENRWHVRRWDSAAGLTIINVDRI